MTDNTDPKLDPSALKPEDFEPTATDKTSMPFGKHKDEELGNVPASYLLWAHGEGWVREQFPGIWKYIESRKPYLEAEAKHE